LCGLIKSFHEERKGEQKEQGGMKEGREGNDRHLEKVPATVGQLHRMGDGDLLKREASPDEW